MPVGWRRGGVDGVARWRRPPVTRAPRGWKWKSSSLSFCWARLPELPQRCQALPVGAAAKLETGRAGGADSRAGALRRNLAGPSWWPRRPRAAPRAPTPSAPISALRAKSSSQAASVLPIEKKVGSNARPLSISSPLSRTVTLRSANGNLSGMFLSLRCKAQPWPARVLPRAKYYSVRKEKLIPRRRSGGYWKNEENIPLLTAAFRNDNSGRGIWRRGENVDAGTRRFNQCRPWRRLATQPNFRSDKSRHAAKGPPLPRGTPGPHKCIFPSGHYSKRSAKNGIIFHGSARRRGQGPISCNKFGSD